MLRCIRSTFGLFIVLVPVMLAVAQTPQNVSVNDDSDWWSIIRENSDGEALKPQEEDVADSNFRLLGIAVGSDELAAIQGKLGKTTVITRGDAGTSRSQICYSGEDNKTYLNFESGEVQYAFYLFGDGPKWTGSDLCTKSKFVTDGLSTVSGLRLGQSPAQVKAILGKPTASLQNGDLIYFRQIKKRTPAADLKRLRQYYSNLNDQEFHENYDFYYLTAYIVARFSDSKLVYLGVSKSEVD